MSDKKTKFFSKIGDFYNRIYSEGFGEKTNKNFVFLYFSGVFGALFFIMSFLSGVNPFSFLIPFPDFLIPFNTFPLNLPTSDKRVQTKIYLSDGKKEAFLSERKVLLEGKSFKSKVYRIITEISEPPFYASEEDIKKKNENITYKKLPNINFAIRTLWIQDKTLIIDLREDTLKRELEIIKVRIDNSIYNDNEEDLETKRKAKLAWEIEQEEKEKKLRKEARIEMLNSAFIVLEKTLFENFSEFDKIVYRLDGNKSDFAGLEYKLSEEKTRN